MEWVASTLHTTSEHGVSSITIADAHTSFASSRLNWRLRRFKWTRPFRRWTKSGFCACAITFQTQSTYRLGVVFTVQLHSCRRLPSFQESGRLFTRSGFVSLFIALGCGFFDVLLYVGPKNRNAITRPVFCRRTFTSYFKPHEKGWSWSCAALSTIFLNVGTKGRWLVTLTHRPLCPLPKTIQCALGRWLGEAPQPVWTFWTNEKTLKLSH